MKLKIGLIIATMVTGSWSMENTQGPSNWFERKYVAFQELLHSNQQPNKEQSMQSPMGVPKIIIPKAFVEDLYIRILGIANGYGLDLKTFRNEQFVCKEWRDLALKSILNLDVFSIMEDGPHDNWTVLAYVIADRTVQKFP